MYAGVDTLFYHLMARSEARVRCCNSSAVLFILVQSSENPLHRELGIRIGARYAVEIHNSITPASAHFPMESLLRMQTRI